MNFGLTNLLSICSSGVSAGNFLCEAETLVNVADSASTIFEMLVNGFLTILGNVVFYIAQFALSVIDVFQVVIYKFLGITYNGGEYVVYDTNNPLIRFLTHDTVITVLRTAMTVAVVLVIIFTIFAIIKGEWDRASKGTEYSVRMVWSRALRSIFGMVIFPAAFMAVIILVNALLASFSQVLSRGTNTTLGGQVFAMCAYDANVYRNYANNNKRIPIYIDFYDPYAEGTVNRYTKDELAAIYDAFVTDGTELYNKFATKDFASFADTTKYNSSTRSLTNDYKAYGEFEKFVCTAEQYHVMADFLDYAVSNGITYYYKPVTSDDIEWKYVDTSIFNPETGSLSITYRDASNIVDGDSYTVVYKSGVYNLGTPIGNALGTLSTALSLNGNYYPMLDHLEGSINKVAWATNKVKLQFSSDYRNTSKWTHQDQILLYEYYRYDYNNTFQDYTLNDIFNGIEVDAYTLECQYYRDYTNSYVTLKTYDVVIINGTYYAVAPAFDKDGNPIYDAYGDQVYQIVTAEKDGATAGVAANSQKGTLLNDLSSYNNKSENAGNQIGVHIECLDTVSDEAWYSADYENSSGTPVLVSEDNHSFVAYHPNIKGEKFETIYDESGIAVGEKYGFPNANGFYHEVDRCVATKQRKEVDWANKLMGDLKVIYRDLNLAQLITTGEWLEIFNSNIEQNGDEYTASFDTSLISPQGLIFSEIFLGILKESDGSNLADYMFASKYSETEKRELVMALCGIEDYETVNTTINYFADTFNLLFTPLLEKIMKGENQQFKVGEVTSPELYTYKAYLCSLLLSSDSAGFFLNICKKLVAMYEFQYEVMLVEPEDYTFALNLVKEYLNLDKLYGVGANKIKYSYDIDKIADIFVKYLDKDGDGEVKNEDLLEIYTDAGEFPDGKISSSEITLQQTPKRLLEEINKALKNVYIPFADIIIKENAEGDNYFGFSLLQDPEDPKSSLLKDYGFIYNESSQKYELPAGVHRYSQISNYDDLCKIIYDKMSAELDNNNTECLLADVYLNVKDNLRKQGIWPGNLNWPEYMTIYSQYLTGTLENAELIFSSVITTDEISGAINEYKTYLKQYDKAVLTLKFNNLAAAFGSNFSIVDVVTQIVNEFLKPYSLTVSRSDVENILKFTFIEDIVEGINKLISTLGSPITMGIDDLMNSYYKDSGLEALFNKYFEQFEDGRDLLTLEELKSYSGLLTGSTEINTSTNDYAKQQLVPEQLEKIIAYANSNKLIASVRILENGKYVNRDLEKDANGKENYVAPSADAVTSQHFVDFLLEFSNNWKNTLLSHRTLMECHKYYIKYAVRMDSTEDVSKTFNFIINNHTYTADITMPTSKLLEYVYGGRYLDYIGFEPAYVDTSYTGFFDLDYNTSGKIDRPTIEDANFNSIQSFLSEFAQVTMKANYLSNLDNLTKSNTDDTPLYEKEKDFENSLADGYFLRVILKYIIDNELLDKETILKYFGIDVTGLDLDIDSTYYLLKETILSSFQFEAVKTAFDNITAHLTGSYKEYHKMSAKQWRLELMNALTDYQADSAASAQENKERYIALFNMFCSDFILQKSETTGARGGVEYNLSFSCDTTTQNMILKLAGIEDKPVEMLVGLEYEDIYAANGYDENNGDVFIMCTFDEESQMYIPFLMNSGSTQNAYIKVNEEVGGESTETSWLKFGHGIARTSYYYGATDENGKVTPVAYPVIAKGIITDDGMPTAIRQIDGVTEFYRDNLAVRNASELQLTAYYMTTENISTNYNLISMITNSISKLITGKTLVEHAYSSIPRFAIDSDIRLPIGMDDEVVKLTNEAMEIDYSLMKLSGLSSQSFYTTTKINFLLLVIAILALFPMIIKALYGVFGRVIDITVYYCMSPIIMSTIALGKNVDKGKEELPIYKKWMESLTKKTLSVFGYVLGFEIFFILVPFFASIDFISPEAFEGMLTLNESLPFLKDVGYIVINRLINLVLIICSGYLITLAPKVLADILGQSDGFSDGEAVKGNIKATVTEVKDTLNGTRAINTINYAKENLKASLGVNQIQDTIGSVKKAGAKVVGKGAEIYLRAHGVDKKTAKEITGQMVENVKQNEENKKDLRDREKVRAYNAYHQQIGMSDSDGLTKQLKSIEGRLYKQSLLQRTESQHKAITKGMDNHINKEKKKKDDAKKKSKK